MKTIKRTVSEIIDNEFREFSMYTIESRAIPSAIDGLKITGRKILYAMINEHGGKRVKVAELGGGLAKFNYHHGEVSAMGTAVGMSQDWSNNVPLLTGHGNFGSRLVPEAAAPRYIFSSLSENYKKYFSDVEVCPFAFDKENPEPAFYLPIIPWVLVNGISGIAVGFKADILPRSPKDLIEATKACLANPSSFLKENKIILPSFPSFKGKIEHIALNQYKTIGTIEYVGRYLYKISELPIGYDRESYMEFLNGLIDKELIKDYEDQCSKDGFGFEVKLTASQKMVADRDLNKYFKLEKSHTEILTTLGYDGKLKIFESVAELIHYFVQYRLTKFGDKIQYDILSKTNELEELTLRAKFIQVVIEQKVDLRNRTKEQLLDFIFQEISPKDFARKFINIPLYECTKDEIVKLQEKIIKVKEVLGHLSKITPTKLFDIQLASVKK